MRFIATLPVALILTACSQSPATNVVTPDTLPSLNVSEGVKSSPRHSVTPEVADHVRQKLHKELRVVDFVFDPSNAVMLQVAVKNDGSRQWGFAEYLCLSLKDWGVDTSEAIVRVVDASKVAASNGNFRSISLGTVQCWDGERWD